MPRALFDSGFLDRGELLVLEPRRLAARLAAARVASEFGEEPGARVGYTMRFEHVGGRGTRIRFVTEGILSRRIVADPMLSGVAVVILDEFHERHVATDLALAYIRQLQEGHRPDLKLLVMSATLEASPVAEYLGRAPIIESEGKRYEIEIGYEPKPSDLPLEKKVVSAARQLAREGIHGDVLVFLPGAAEIRKTTEALVAFADQAGLLVLPLHGDLPPSDQSKAIEPAARRKLILATNVAETSITIPSVTGVIDSGLARVAFHSAWSGLPLLRVAKISKSSAAQRAGRAGRLGNGRVLRLFTQQDFDARVDHELPEIRRVDLTDTVLTLHGAGIRDLRAFPWFEPPPPAAVGAAEELLRRLGAVDQGGVMTSRGRRILRFPVHPRLGRLIEEGEKLGVGEDASLVASLLSERNIRIESRDRVSGLYRSGKTRAVASSDLLELRDCYREAEASGFQARYLLSNGLDPGAVDRVRRAQKQMSHLLVRGGGGPKPDYEADEALRIAILAAYPDRVARRRSPGSRDLVLSGGGAARLAAESCVHEANLMVAADASEQLDRHGRSGDALIRLASAIEPEWLAALFPEEIRETVELVWNDPRGRVDETRRSSYGQVTLEERTQPARPSPATANLLAERVESRGLSAFPDAGDLPTLLARLAILAKYYPEENLRPPDAADVSAEVRRLCEGKRSFSDLSGVSLCEVLRSRLTGRQRDLLARETPERCWIGKKRQVKIHYESERSPWIESRLQDFIGVKPSPSLCGGRLALTIHLLAPNGRAVQVTQDLPGFWKRHYPAARRELQRRYPKHAWPDPDQL